MGTKTGMNFEYWDYTTQSSSNKQSRYWIVSWSIFSIDLGHVLRGGGGGGGAKLGGGGPML